MNAQNLDDYFASAADRPLAYSDDLLGELLRRYDQGMIPLELDNVPPSLGARFAAVVGGISLMILLGFALSSGGYLDHDPDSGNREGIVRLGGGKAGYIDPGELDEDVTVWEIEKPGNRLNPTRPYIKRVSVNTILCLHLNSKELANLGVRSFDSRRMKQNRIFDGSVVQYFRLKKDGRWSVTSLGKAGGSVDLRQIDDGILPTPRRFGPSLITDPIGHRRGYAYSFTTVDTDLTMEWRRLVQLHHDRYGTDWRGAKDSLTRQIYALWEKIDSLAQIQTSRINALVGIYVETGDIYTAEDSIAGRWHPDCILWYEPTPEFLAALPDRYRNGITPFYADAPSMPRTLSSNSEPSSSTPLASVDPRKEVSTVDTEITRPAPNVPSSLGPMRTNQETPSLNNAMTGASAGVQQSTSASGAILRVLLGENPTQNATTLLYILSEPRRLTLSLHSIDGYQLQNVVESANYPSGSGTIPLDLSDFPPGMYLVALTSDQGEQVIVRVIVQR